jgi:translocator protein
MRIVKLLTSILICLSAGIIGSYFTTPAIQTWYAGLNKPIFIPPNWVFAPVWTTIFILMGISFYLVWIKGLNRKALFVFIIQLALNILWSAIFFGLCLPVLALIEIVVLWAVILINIVLFYRISKIASALLVPYILWVTVAIILNLSIVIYN